VKNLNKKKIIGSIVFSLILPLFTVGYILLFNFCNIFYKKWANKLTITHWGKICLSLLKNLIGLKVKYYNVPKDLSGSIITSEHQSALEIIALIAVIPKPIFVLKKSLMSIPIFGTSLKNFGMIGIDRTKYNINWIKEAQMQLSKGKNLIIFPEGTRVGLGKEVAYKNGAFKLAQHLNKKIMPVAINTNLFWPRKSIIKKAGTANIIFGDFIEPNPQLLRDTCKQLKREII
jgi:1-acyl-sn-glycerol-3-phosphate acyltransferase